MTTHPPPLAIDGRSDFQAALPQALDWAAARGARRLWLSDADFADWPLDDDRWLAPLAAWLRLPLRRLTLIGGDYAAVPRRHPRFTAWRRDWGHAIDAWTPAERGLTVPTLLVDDGPVLLELLDPATMRGRSLHDAAAARAWRDQIDALLQQCDAGFAPTVLGL